MTKKTDEYFTIDQLKYEKFNVELLMDRVIKKMGGIRIDELGKHSFPNADYIFHDEKIIIELKTFKKEFSHEEYKKHLRAMHKVFMQNPEFKFKMCFDTSLLTTDQRFKINDFFNKRFKSII